MAPMGLLERRGGFLVLNGGLCYVYDLLTSERQRKGVATALTTEVYSRATRCTEADRRAGQSVGARSQVKHLDLPSIRASLRVPTTSDSRVGTIQFFRKYVFRFARTNYS